VSPLLRMCGCGQLTSDRVCPACRRADNMRRAAKQREHGRDRAAWRRLRLEVLARDGWTCRVCGSPATTVHITPELNGNHDAATVDACVSLCRRCHGRTDGRRAHRDDEITRGGRMPSWCPASDHSPSARADFVGDGMRGRP
jgi:5-methylcytosine-specific restriction endonuclease McrA